MPIYAILLQSCSSDETQILLKKTDNLSQSDDFQNYLISFNEYKLKTFEIIESLPIEERELLFNNLNNDDYITSFMKKYDLIDNNIALQKATFALKQNQDWASLKDTEKGTLLINNFDPIITVIPRLKSGEEIGISNCEKNFNDGMTRLNALTSLKLIGCTCMLEVPIAACICYTTVMAEHYLAIEKLAKEREECERNS